DLRAQLLRRERRWALAAVAVACSIPVAFVLARNLGEWGDPFAVAALEKNWDTLVTPGARAALPSMAHYYGVELPALFGTYFFVAYGAINFPYGGHLDWAQWAPSVIAAGLVVSALVRSVWRQVDARALAILAVGFALFFATYVYPGYRYRWLQARYFFNQLPFLCLISAVGLASAWRGLGRLGAPVSERALVALVYLGLVALNALVLGEGVWHHLYRYIGPAD